MRDRWELEDGLITQVEHTEQRRAAVYDESPRVRPWDRDEEMPSRQEILRDMAGLD